MNRPVRPQDQLPASGFFTKASVLARYQISKSTLHAWQVAGIFPAGVLIGPRAVRFRAEDLAAYEADLIAKHEVRANASSAR